MYLLPKPKRTKKREGFYEICWNTVITIDEALSEHGFVYAGILQECIRKSAGIECAILRGTKREGDIFLTLTPECGVQEYQMHIGPDGLVIAGGDGAAVLYGVGARLDQQPALFFELRSIEMERFIDVALANKVEAMLANAQKPSSRIITGQDLESLFGVI